MKKIVISLLLLLVTSCAQYDKKLGVPVEVMYADALEHLHDGQISLAKDSLENIFNNYPFSEEALEATIMLIWVYYIEKDLVSLEVTTDTFLRYYQSNPYTPWVRYMSAIVRYDQIGSFDKDQTFAYEAIDIFNSIINDPSTRDTKYAKDAKYKIEVIKYNLSQRLSITGYNYLEQKEYLAAIKVYTSLVESYSDTVFVEEALYRLVYAWLTLGVHEEAFRINAVLGYNYPDGIWYEKSLNLMQQYTSYEEDTTLISNR